MNTSDNETRVKAIVRLRPLTTIEQQKDSEEYEYYTQNSHQTKLTNKTQRIYTLNTNDNILKINRLYDNTYFHFDSILDEDSTQSDIFRSDEVQSVVQGVLKGLNGGVLGYGLTGSGKTYTIFGETSNLSDGNDDMSGKGIAYRSLYHLFRKLDMKKEKCERTNDIEFEYEIECSFVQIYLEHLSDLFNESNDLDQRNNISNNNRTPFCTTKRNDNNLRRKRLQGNNSTGLVIYDTDNGVQIRGLNKIKFNSFEEGVRRINSALNKYRYTHRTNLNETSSRSHVVLQYHIKQSLRKLNQCINKSSKMYIVDLAGSERVTRSSLQGLRLEEAKNINLSITALGKCIRALTKKNKRREHIPYRDSKLTRILSCILNGDARICLVINITPSFAALDESISSLTFGQDAVKIRLKPKLKEETIQFQEENKENHNENNSTLLRSSLDVSEYVHSFTNLGNSHMKDRISLIDRDILERMTNIILTENMTLKQQLNETHNNTINETIVNENNSNFANYEKIMYKRTIQNLQREIMKLKSNQVNHQHLR